MRIQIGNRSGNPSGITGGIIGLCVLSYMFYDVFVRQWLRNGFHALPWPVLLFFLLFYFVFIWRLVRDVRAKLHPEQACEREEKRQPAKASPPAARPRRSNQLHLKLVPLALSLLFMGAGGFMIVKSVRDAARVTSVPLPLLGFFGLFLAVGLMIFFFVIRSVVLDLRPKAERSFFNERLRHSLPRELKHLAFFSVLWNVFVWTFLGVFQGVSAVPVSPVAFLLAIFPVVGLGLVVKLVWGIVSYCCSPRFELTATCSAFREGEQMQVAYELRDGSNVADVTVEVVSTNLDLRSGDSLAEDPQGGIGVEVFHLRDAVRMRMGSFAFKIPSMPPARRRSWKLRVTTSNTKGRENPVEYALC